MSVAWWFIVFFFNPFDLKRSIEHLSDLKRAKKTFGVAQGRCIFDMSPSPTTDNIRRTANETMKNAEHVAINSGALQDLAKSAAAASCASSTELQLWSDFECHFRDPLDDEKTILYVLVVSGSAIRLIFAYVCIYIYIYVYVIYPLISQAIA